MTPGDVNQNERSMKKYHIIYTLNDEVLAEEKEFKSFSEAEVWLAETGASYWEIGMSEQDFKEMAYKIDENQNHIKRRAQTRS